MKKIFTLLFLSCTLFALKVGAQTIYKSAQTGAWNSASTWLVSTDNGVSYNPAAATPTSNNSVIISAGHTVNIPSNITAGVLNITIEAGGVLTDGGIARGVRPGTSSSGTAGTVATLTANGTFGGSSDLSVLEVPNTAASVTVTGTGTINIGRIRFITTNNNYPTSAIAGHANSAQLIIDRDINLKVAGNYAFSGPNSSVAATDVFVLTINAGKTVTVSDPGSRWENTLMATGGAATGGSYTYNINGTLDLSATTATSAFIPYSNASSAINVNVNGTVKLGTIFKADTVNTSAGSISLNIGNGGLLDATNSTTFQSNRRGTASGNIFWVVSGTGALRRTVGGVDTEFPIGTSTNNYNGVVLNNAGTSDTYTVGVSNTVSNTSGMPDATKIVNKQWSIVEGTAGGSNTTVKLSWVTADQGTNFNPASLVSIARWNGTGWQYFPATVSGTGTTADPYVATSTTGFTSDFTAANPFIVVNNAALPVSFYGVKAFSKDKGVQVEWLVSTEVNTAGYVIERSANGKDFSPISNVAAAGNTSYSVFDATPIAGVNYYRIKATDKDASLKFSSVVAVNILKNKAEIVVAPNPVKNNFNLQFAGLEKGNYTVKLVNSVGQVVFTQQVNVDAAALSKSFTLPAGVKNGIYTIQIVGSDFNTSKRIVVE